MTQQQQQEQQPVPVLGGSADLLEACFARLPLADQALTVGCLSQAWQLWAAPRFEALRRGMARATANRRPAGDIPGWYVKEAWPYLSKAQRGRATLMCARSGQLEVLQWARQQEPPCAWDEKVC